MNAETLERELLASGQDHLVRHLRTARALERERLVRQLSGFDYDLVRKLSALARKSETAQTIGGFEAAPVLALSRPRAEADAARAVGEEAIRAGQVAAFIVAGGQASRLQFDGPKGCFPIGPVSGKSLFQILAEKVLAASRRYRVAIPLYIMTSKSNDAETREFFRRNNWFGLRSEDVFFLRQRVLPAFDTEGRLLLETADRVFVSPDGHGGSFVALETSGALADMVRRGIHHVAFVQVDNPLVPVLDPLFIGEHIRAGSEMSSKVLRKRDPLEKLAVFGHLGGVLRAIEYSEMTSELQQERRPDGSLKHAFGSIATHAIDVAFARRMATADLPFHMARKRIPFLDGQGRQVEPERPNGVKLERFVFDAIPHARNPVVMEVLREDEFAPVKNFSGADSAETARAALMAQQRRWLREAGIDAPDDLVLEISPLFALDAAELRAKATAVSLSSPLYLG